MYGQKAISIKYVFFTKGDYSFRIFKRIRELIRDCWRSHRESTFVNIQLSFRGNNLFVNGLPKGPRDIRELCWLLSRKSMIRNSSQFKFNSIHN